VSNEKRPLTPQGGFDLYRVPDAPAALHDPEQDGAVLADRGTRLFARFVDGLTWGAVFLVGILVAVFAESLLDSDAAAGLGVFSGAFLALGVLGVNLSWLASDGQTIGKRVTGIAIVRRDGSQASLGRLIGLRWFLMLLLGYIPMVGLVNPLLIFRRDQRCLHDHLADTIVVRAPGR
jgi:uncharacterized RDD family membrane protein YckC